MDKHLSIHSSYLTPAVIAQCKKKFAAENVVVLASVLTDAALTDAKKKLRYGWQHHCIADRYSFSTHTKIALQGELTAFVSQLTNTSHSPFLQRFKHGDYVVLHDKHAQKAGVKAMLFLDEWNVAWGGNVVVMRNGKTIFSYSPKENTLLLFRLRTKERYFIKYVNTRAQRNAQRIIGL